MEPLVLIVEDDKTIRHFIRVSLETQKYTCLETDTGGMGISLCLSRQPDVLILDLGLPDIDGIEVIRSIRETSSVPILVVSARGHEREKVEALDAGADDYLTKPFGIGELLARIRVILRHRVHTLYTEENVSSWHVGALTVDFEKRRVMLDGQIIHLTPTEYKLLSILAIQHGRVLTHRYLAQEIWGGFNADNTQSLRVCMGSLRRKLEANPAQPKYIVTEVGVGYRMVDEC